MDPFIKFLCIFFFAIVYCVIDLVIKSVCFPGGGREGGREEKEGRRMEETERVKEKEGERMEETERVKEKKGERMEEIERVKEKEGRGWKKLRR